MNDLSTLSILYVEDEPELRDHVAYALRLHSNAVTTAVNGKEALESIQQNRPDLVISDIRMPVMDGLELTAAIHRDFPGLPVILCTAFTDTGYLLKAIEMGVAAYVLKPIDTSRLLEAVQQAALPVLQRRELEQYKLDAVQARGLLIGTSPAMKTLGEQLVQVAGSDYFVVIRGEAATGKSAFAELLHSMSKRMAKPLLTINCRGRSSEQLEAELFGAAPGRGRPSADRSCGAIFEIDGGTLVLDSPEFLSLPLQERLLHTLEEHSYVPTGTIEPVHCNVRAIVITTAELEKEAQAGRFSHDLWLRLSDVVLTVPTLRERSEDLPRFCRSFLAQAADELGQPCPELTDDAVLLLQKEAWPGNLRQLKQFIRRALFLTDDPITADSLKPQLAMFAGSLKTIAELPQSLKLTDLEEWAIRQALCVTGGKKMQAADLLGISYNSFKEKIRRYNI